MRFFLLLLLAALPASADTLPQQIDRYVGARTQLGQFSGVVLVATRDGVVLRKAYGYANFELDVPMTTAAKFEIASLSKAFTAAAVLLLRDDGKLALDDSVCKYTDPCPAAWQPVTVAELLHHTSGIPDYESALGMETPAYANAMAAIDAPRRLVGEARAKPLDFAPGTKFNYSNTGYLLLGFIVEKVSGATYRDFVQKRILTPLHLDSTGVVDRTQIVKNRADGYTGVEGLPIERVVAGYPLLGGPFRRAIYTRLPDPEGDASLYSTADDLYRWIVALDEGKLLSKDSLHEMFTPGLGDYGTGWFTRERWGRKRRTHSGQLPGFVSTVDRWGDGELTVIVLCNIDVGRIGRVANDIAAIAFGKPYDVPRAHAIVPLDLAVVPRVSGRYKIADGRIVTVAMGKRWLEASIPKEYVAGLLPESALQFYMPLGEGTFRFDEEVDGKTTRLTMHYNGADVVATRIGDATN